MRSTVGYSSCFFFITWIILGNYVILNLFLAIMLDSFSTLDNDSEAKTKNIRIVRSSITDKHRDERLKQIENLSSESEDESTENRLSFIKKSLQPSSYIILQLSNRFRSYCVKLYSSPKFEAFIIIIISLSAFISFKIKNFYYLFF